MTKQEQIAAKKIKPIEVGDTVMVIIPYQVSETRVEGRGKKKQAITEEIDKVFKNSGEVLSINDDLYEISLNTVSIPSQIKNERIKSVYNGHEHSCFFPKEFLSPTFTECGSNPFAKEKNRITFYNKDIESLLSLAGYGRRAVNIAEQDGNNRVNFDPFIVNSDGKVEHYQRGLIWTLEQKQLLIDSIYQGIEIGKFLFRYNSWERREKFRKENPLGIAYDFDCVDGKQRFHTIIEFISGKFPDSHGNFWEDLSSKAQRRFGGFANLSYGELSENSTDNDVIDNFLTLNFTGTPMSKDHIEYVKSIKL